MNADQFKSNRENRLLAALQPHDFAVLSPHLKDLHFNQGVLLQEVGDPIEQIYFPHHGMISILAVMQEGTAVETATIGREGAVGAMAGLGTRHARAASRRLHRLVDFSPHGG
jgi:CRP-like cAMP-binding protein